MRIILFLLISAAVFSQTPDESFKKGVDCANKGKYDEAISEMKKALEASPLYAEYHLNLGVVYANKKEYDEAIKEGELAAKARPDSITTFYLLGMLYEKKNNNEKALASWQRVLELNPRETMKELAEKHVKRLKDK